MGNTTFSFAPQSYKWSKYRVELDEDVELVNNETACNVKLFRTIAGNLEVYKVSSGGVYHAVHIERYSGRFDTSKCSEGEPVYAMASKGSWSGGGNYSGFIFGKPGMAVFFNRKGVQKWLLFKEDHVEWVDTPPGVEPQEL